MSFPTFKVKLNSGVFSPKGGNTFLAPHARQLGLLFFLALYPIFMKGRREQLSRFLCVHSFSFTVNNQFCNLKQGAFSKQNQ